MSPSADLVTTCWDSGEPFVKARCSLLFQRIIELNGGQPPLTYKRFQALINRMDAVELPAERITLETMQSCVTPVSENHDDKFGVPSLEELGEQLVSCVWRMSD